MRTGKRRIAAGVAFALGATLAHAQSIRPTYEFPAAPDKSGPASVQMGGSPFFFTPYIGVGVGHDDNVTYAPTNATSSALYVVSPGLKIDARSVRSVFQFDYEGQIARYSDSKQDDYEDHRVSGQFDFAFDRRNFLRANAAYLLGHDPRGLTDRPVSAEPDKYRIASAGGMYSFGAPGAAGRVELYYDEARKRYRNNLAFTSSADRNNREYGGAFYVRLGPRTYAMAEARETRIKYVQPSDFSAKERRYYGGLSWDVTDATTGIVKVGRFERNFDSALPDYSDFAWEASIIWTPRTYSRWEFNTLRYSTEQTGLGTFIVTDAAGVAWTHNWATYLMTTVDLRYQKDDYQGFSRKDDTMALGLKVGYKFRRWLTLGAEYTYTKRDSTFDPADYEKNLYFLTATASM